ncbi:MAG: hypothetical protein MSA72_19175 [Lachnospiraceae bacterium]|nr:hypothetical protein [Lachnospiraceae bacterium]
MDRKRMMSVILGLCLIFCMGGCGSKNETENAKPEETGQTVDVSDKEDIEKTEEKEEPVKKVAVADTRDTDMQVEEKTEVGEEITKVQEENKMEEKVKATPDGQKKSQEQKEASGTGNRNADTKKADTPKTDAKKEDPPKAENTKGKTKESSKETESRDKAEAAVEKEPHVHQWTDKTEVRHHDAVTEQAWVEDVPAWDEEVPVYEEREQAVCVTCGAEIQGNPNEHLNEVCRQWKNVIKKVQVGNRIVHHEAEGHYEIRTVEEAYDEVVITGAVCTGCGAAK